MLIERLERVALLGSSWVLYLLILLSIVSIGVMVERWLFFQRSSGDAYDLGDRILARLSEGDRSGAEKVIIENRSIEASVDSDMADLLRPDIASSLERRLISSSKSSG